MRRVYKGMIVKVLTGPEVNKTANVVRGANCFTGSGRATLKLVKRNGGKASTFLRSVRSVSFVRWNASVNLVGK